MTDGPSAPEGALPPLAVTTEQPISLIAKAAENKEYPPDLTSAINEARRHDLEHDMGIEPDDPPERTQRFLDRHLENAEWYIREGGKRKSGEYWAMYNAVNGQIRNVGDFLELARTRPELAGGIPPERMYAILALTYERAWSPVFLQLSQSFGVGLTPEEKNAELDRRNSLNKQAESFKSKAGETEYKSITDLANTPEFARFVPRMGYTINPALLSK